MGKRGDGTGRAGVQPKIADTIPVLAQQAYDRLLQRYNIEAQESDRAYGRWIDAYGRTRDIADLSNRLAQQSRTGGGSLWTMFITGTVIYSTT